MAEQINCMNKTIKKDVYTILNLLPNTRRSDDILIRVYCDFAKISTDLGATDREHITVADVNYITRCRRKHQEEFPDLYPNNINEIREEERKAYKKEFKK